MTTPTYNSYMIFSYDRIGDDANVTGLAIEFNPKTNSLDYDSPIILTAGARGADSAVTADGKRIFIPSTNKGRIDVLYTAKKKKKDPPISLSTSRPDNIRCTVLDKHKKLYVTGTEHNAEKVQVIDIGDENYKTSSIYIQNKDKPGTNLACTTLTVTPTSEKNSDPVVYVCGKNTDKYGIYTLDLATNKATQLDRNADVTTPRSATIVDAVAVTTKHGVRIYALEDTANAALVVVDHATRKVINHLPLPKLDDKQMQLTLRIAATPDGSSILAPCSHSDMKNGALFMHDTKNGTFPKRFDRGASFVATGPGKINRIYASDPDEQKIFILNSQNGEYLVTLTPDAKRYRHGHPVFYRASS